MYQIYIIATVSLRNFLLVCERVREHSLALGVNALYVSTCIISSITLHLLVHHFWPADILHQIYHKHFALNSFLLYRCVKALRLQYYYSRPWRYRTITYVTLLQTDLVSYICFTQFHNFFSCWMYIYLPITLTKVNGLHNQNRKKKRCILHATKNCRTRCTRLAVRNKVHGSFATNLMNFPLPHYCKLIRIRWDLGHAVVQWLRHCATNRKVAGSIPDGVRIFHWNNPSGRAMALGSTQPLTEMSTRPADIKFFTSKIYCANDGVNYTPKHVAIWALICKLYIQ
jgi:hypothetical protein